MGKVHILSGIAFTFLLGTSQVYADSCNQVRLAEPGWTDLAYTTGIAEAVLGELGYETKSDVLGLPVIYASLENKDLDAFLGYWDPAMETFYRDYKERDAVITTTQNLTGAKFTLAVPKYVYDAGVRDFADLAKHAEKFDHKMYGIEPGSNDIMDKLIKDNAFDLGSWSIVESSEQGMLSQVKRSTRREKWVVFLGWAPHPMNSQFDIAYLTGGDDYYGPNYGGATVHTQMRKGYEQACPNVAKFLNNLVFDIELESEGMGYILNDHLSPKEAAIKTIRNHPEYLDKWLAGVTTRDGGEGLASVKKALVL
ncbi:choline ABC transporter substrate-binding protein [Kiloniella sp.]|uniref:choline ABC transporter substrate-binding protein n=1 Tax=Kiloniella sp. TaxID=1938587 RepID=UPI003A94306F